MPNANNYHESDRLVNEHENCRQKKHLAAREKHGVNYTNTEEELEDHAVAVNRDKFN